MVNSYTHVLMFIFMWWLDFLYLICSWCCHLVSWLQASRFDFFKISPTSGYFILVRAWIFFSVPVITLIVSSNKTSIVSFCSRYSVASSAGVQHLNCHRCYSLFVEIKSLQPLTSKSSVLIQKCIVCIWLATGSHKVGQVIFSPLECSMMECFRFLQN